MSKGFTLIELLVVITIIVVLLALLTPALDKAIYQAELAVCMTQQRAMVNGILMYSQSHKRRYPTHEFADEAHMLYNGIADPETENIKHELNEYFGVNATLNDPFGEPVDIMGAQTSSFIYLPWAYWFGWEYKGAGGGSGMMKQGNRWSFTGDGQTRRYKIMAADMDLIEGNGPGAAYVGHPDKDGVLSNWVLQDESYFGVPSVSLAGFSGTLDMVFSFWHVGEGPRGVIDMNVSYDDASVFRHNEVIWDEAVPGAASNDGRMVRVPIVAEDGENVMYEEGQWNNVPVR